MKTLHATHRSTMKDNSQTHGQTCHCVQGLTIILWFTSMCHSVIIIITVLCLNFVDNDIGAKVFSQMTEEELNNPSLAFSFGVKKLLKMILAIIKV